MEAARTERPAGWPGAPLARTGLLLLSTWVLAGAEITWGATGGPGRPVAPASRPPALPPLFPRAVVSQWPEQLATARRGAALGRRPGPEPLPQPGGGSGSVGKKQGEAGGPSPAGALWEQGTQAQGKPGGARRSRRAQPPSALERGDARATALADGSKGSRPLAKGLREEVKAPRAGGAAAEELRLPSTSFALTGDSAHNQAMVHWSGHNSSVILILTKLYDFNLGSVTESSLWRSTDYGTTYEKLNDKVGLKTVLSYLYVNPTNKRKIMLLSDPEMESSILISSDEGATYQKYRLTFYIQSLLFHPKQEDWVLAYSLDQKLYSSMDFGRRWQLMHERITPNRFYWSVAGLDKEADLVHMEVRTADGYAHYLTCRIQECAETTRSGPFARSIDISSLVVQDEYIFIQVTTGGRASYYVSYRREAFAQIKLPKYSLPKDMHIISTVENQVFAAVQEWNQNDTYNLYISDTRGIYFTLAMENIKSSRGLMGNIIIELYEVAGIKGIFLANKKVDDQVKTYITYNKGRDWRLLQAPDVDLRGSPVHCLLPFCSLHLHLQISENPYSSGRISSKETAPGLLVATGNIGPELSYTDIGVFISSDGGNTWRQIFDEEYNVWFLDWGGALVAMKHTPLPVRHLWVSFDEGHSWDKYGFTSVPLFVDGALVEAGVETQIMTVFGHFSLRSEWQLVKVDYKSIFSRRCTKEDYQTWHLLNQGEPCVMGERKIFKKRKPGAQCALGRDSSGTVLSEPCVCADWDFECDYGYERHGESQCVPAFWYNPASPSKDCSLGQSYLNSTGWNKCDYVGWCANSWKPYPFVWHEFRDKENFFYLFGCPVEHVHLRVPFVAIRNKEVNISAVVWPSQLGTLTYFWWFGNSTKPLITLDSSISFTFLAEGTNTITVQVAAGNALIQDTKDIAVHEYFQSQLLSFSPNLDYHNPDIPEWRQDIGNVIKRALVKVTGVPEDQILVAVFPGLPTSAELFILPPKNLTERRKGNEEDLEQIVEMLFNALNQNLVQFELKPGVQVIVYVTQLTLAPLVDSSAGHSSSAMLMLLSVVFVGLAVFLIYKFKRKIPWINIYAQVQHDKEQEMIGSVSQSENAPKITLSDFTEPEELLDKELDTRVIGGIATIANSESTKEIPNCTSV
ncbi:VPS10 domain-containing receptor SorCS3 [Ailuropoda melanoleuca]|uniref:VPS10 domain-containing receptor SorCS3 n=1 Tax=Ailuropoda melanoleuca TaxID=9646 RepID=UPI001494684F|nr:VPS10 domain-containing receptor SorCS3 [Ailuropoda melanoleuca]